MNSGDFRLITGLGNPGQKYINNRHNVGFMALDLFAKKQNVRFNEKSKLYGLLADIQTTNQSIKLLKPSTFMNDSGRSIRAAIDWYGFNINQLIILVDDMDIPLGRLRIREEGSSGGHNGLKSAINHLGTQKFCRLRIGIGSPSQTQEERKSKTISHVLGNFSEKENKALKEILKEVLACLQSLNNQDFTKLCTRINSYKINIL